MAVFRVEHNKNYSTMSNYHFRDTALSWKAKGLLSNMLSLPPNWDYSLAGLEKLASDKSTSTRSGIKELIEHNYLIRRPVREGGRIVDWEYIIFEDPEQCRQFKEKEENQVVEKLVVENQQVENQHVENQAQLNTNKLTTNNKLITNELNTKIKRVFDFWNAQNIINHKELKPEHEKAIASALKQYDIEELHKYIDRYAQVLNDKDYYFSTKWTLAEFLKQSNAISAFTDEGSKWLNYLERDVQQKPKKDKSHDYLMEIYQEFEERGE